MSNQSQGKVASVRAVAFDFFGVICPDLVDNWLTEEGLSDRASEIRARYVGPADLGLSSMDQLCDQLGAIVGRSGGEVSRRLQELAVLDEAAVALLRKTSERKKTAICSNAPQGLVQRILADNGLNGSVQTILVSSDIGVAKPAPIIYEELAAVLRCLPEEIVFIDDRRANIEGAEVVGMQTILYSSATAAALELNRLESV